MLGLSERWSGVIQDTASTATFVALVCARERASNHAATRGGLQGQTSPLIVYVSAQAHSSVEKAALLAGFGRENLRVIPGRRQLRHARGRARHGHRDGSRGRARALRHRRDLRHHRDHGLRPASPRSRRSRAREELWLHVDAAMAGIGDDPARVPRPLGWRRRRRLAGREPAQVARRLDGLLHVLRARPAVPRARHVDQPELPADRGRRAGEELPRLGLAARAPHARAQVVVRDPRSGRERAAGAHPPRSRARAMAGGRDRRDSRAGRFSRRCACRRWSCATSRRVSMPRPSTRTRAPGRRPSTNRARHTSLRRSSTDRWAVRVSIGAAATAHEHVVDLWQLMRETAQAIQEGAQR